MSKKNEETPEQCPFVDTCEQLVAKAEYEYLCTASVWLFCPKAEAEGKKYLKKPRQWKKKGL